MNNFYSKFMRYGKHVVSSYTGEVFTIKESHAESEKEGMVKCVADCNLRQYELLKTWQRNHVGITEEQKKEMESYEQWLKISDVKPADKVRFITPHYETKFEVEDFGFMKLSSGKILQVVFVDECHFAFLLKSGGMGSVYHICQYAELLEMNGDTVSECPGLKMQKA